MFKIIGKKKLESICQESYKKGYDRGFEIRGDKIKRKEEQNRLNSLALSRLAEIKQYFNLGDTINYLNKEYLIIGFEIEFCGNVEIITRYRSKDGELRGLSFVYKRLPVLIKENNLEKIK